MFANITHQQAVEVLKAAEDRIILLVRKSFNKTRAENCEHQDTKKGKCNDKKQI